MLFHCYKLPVQASRGPNGQKTPAQSCPHLRQESGREAWRSPTRGMRLLALAGGAHLCRWPIPVTHLEQNTSVTRSFAAAVRCIEAAQGRDVNVRLPELWSQRTLGVLSRPRDAEVVVWRPVCLAPSSSLNPTPRHHTIRANACLTAGS